MSLKNKLENYKKQKALIGVYENDSNTEKFLAGFVLQVNEVYCVMLLVGPEGKDDGYILLEIEDIFSVIDGGEYLEALTVLYEHSKKYNGGNIHLETSHLFESFIRIALQNQWVGQFYLMGDMQCDFQGVLIDTSSDECQVLCLTDYGKEDGVRTILCDTITRVSYNGEHERSVSLLYKTQRKQDEMQ